MRDNDQRRATAVPASRCRPARTLIWDPPRTESARLTTAGGA